MLPKTKYTPRKPIFLLLLLIFSSLLTPISSSASSTSAPAKYITLTAPEIKSGENLVKIGDTKYIRYTIALNEYKTLHYSKIDFNLEFDDRVLELYTTNINLGQIYAYDVSGGVTKNTQNSIVWYEPKLDKNKVSFSSYSTTGMWFKDGIVVILYFLPRDGTALGDVCNVTLTDFYVSVINPDGSAASMDDVAAASVNGGITLTESKSFNAGETADPASETSPLKGKGQAGVGETASPGSSGDNAPYYYSIAVLIILMISAVTLFGILKIRKMLRYVRLPDKRKYNNIQPEDIRDDSPKKAGNAEKATAPGVGNDRNSGK